MGALQGAARLIAEARHLAVLTGAGVSAESRIPTFRGFGGLWRGRDPMSLATTEAFVVDQASRCRPAFSQRPKLPSKWPSNF